MDESSIKLYSERDRPKKANFIKVRFIIAVLATLCPVVCYISRQNLPFAIVSMTEGSDTQEHPSEHRPNANLVIPEPKLAATILSDDLGLLANSTAARAFDVAPAPAPPPPPAARDGGSSEDKAGAGRGSHGSKYVWSADDRGILLGAFYYTYVLCQIPGARLAERNGTKWILAAATLGSAFFSFLAPWAASKHVHLLSLTRLLMGVCQAAVYPACFVLYSKWLPPVERSQALPILCVGAYVGSIVASSLTGYFSEQPSLGWEYSFYMPAVLCALWTLFWVLVATDEPREHPSISIEELVYIESKMEASRTRPPSAAAGCPDDELSDSGQPAKKADISWRKLFSSRSIWAMMVAFFASNWSFGIVLLLIPSYLNSILHVSPMDNGIINSIIYVLYCVSSPLVGTGSTMMVETRACGLSRLSIRKLFQSTALFGQALCFVALPMLGCQQGYVFAVLFIQIVFYSFVNGGEVQLPTELSVDYAGTIYAIGNCVGSSTGFIVPFVHSQIVANQDNQAQWELFFYLAALISTLGGLVFISFGANHQHDFSINDPAGSQASICKLTGVQVIKGETFMLEDTISYHQRKSITGKLELTKG